MLPVGGGSGGEASADPDAYVGAPAGEAVEPAPRRRRNRWNVALRLLTVLALVAAVGLAAWSRTISADADTARHQAAEAAHDKGATAAAAVDEEKTRFERNNTAGDVVSALGTFTRDVTDMGATTDQLTQVQNRAVDLDSRGDVSGAIQLLHAEGDPLAATLSDEMMKLDAAMADIDVKLQALQASLDG